MDIDFRMLSEKLGNRAKDIDCGFPIVHYGFVKIGHNFGNFLKINK